MATIARWHMPERDRYGRVVKKGYYTYETVPDPPKPDKPKHVHASEESSPAFWVTMFVLLCICLWFLSLFVDDEQTGSCRYEPGYMGQAEVVECYEP